MNNTHTHTHTVHTPGREGQILEKKAILSPSQAQGDEVMLGADSQSVVEDVVTSGV